MQTLLSPLPQDARVTRRPVGSPEASEHDHRGPLEGMEQIMAEVSTDGTLRIALVVVRGGKLLAVNDTILTQGPAQVRAGDAMVPASVTESAGGKVEDDGTVLGTRWLTRTVDDPAADPDAPTTQATRFPLSQTDAAGLLALARELVGRA